MKRWCLSGLCGFFVQGFAIVMPLPPVPMDPTVSNTPAPAATEASAPVGGKNSVKTQALLDQLFNKTDYKDFAEQTPLTLTSGDAP